MGYLRDLGNVPFLKKLLNGERMPSEYVSFKCISSYHESYPFEPANLKLFGNSLLSAPQNSSFSSAARPSTPL